MDRYSGTAVVIYEDEEAIEHHGTKGMKWGVWNAETRARYLGVARHAGKALAKTAKSASGSVAKGAEIVSSKAKLKASSTMTARKEAKQAKAEQKEAIKEQRKELGMTRKEYNALREKTLKSHDPRVVEKGMHTLTDAELNEKISRLQREETISKMATSKTTRIHNERKARSEAIQANPAYKIGKQILDKQLGLSGNSAKSAAEKLKNTVEQNKKSNESKKNDQSSENSQNGKQSQSYQAPERNPQTYRNVYDSDSVRKVVRESALYESYINSDNVKSAADSGRRYLTDGTVRAEVIEVTPISAESENRRKALPAGRG